MSFLDKLKAVFNSKSTGENSPVEKEMSRFMPESQAPSDELFTYNFKVNGGRFLYCASMDEAHEMLQAIIDENNWTGAEALCYDRQIPMVFKDYDLNYTDNINSKFFFTRCEYLIANDGSVLVSSRQIREKKINDLPDHFVLLASTSQIVRQISEGLRGIKTNHEGQIPTNITTIKHFASAEEKDFLSYGSSTKTVYLLLLEDL